MFPIRVSSDRGQHALAEADAPEDRCGEPGVRRVHGRALDRLGGDAGLGEEAPRRLGHQPLVAVGANEGRVALLGETRVGEPPDVGELVRVGRGAEEPRETPLPCPSRTAAAASPQDASTSLPGGATRMSAPATSDLPRRAGTDRVEAEPQPGRARAEAAAEIGHATAGPQSSTAASTRGGGLLGIRGGRAGEADEVEASHSRRPPARPSPASAAMVRLSSSWFATARVPLPDAAPHRAQGVAGEPVARDMRADSRDADDRSLISQRRRAPLGTAGSGTSRASARSSRPLPRGSR